MKKRRLADAAGPKGNALRPFRVTAVRYIKLGPGRKWAADSIKRGIVPLDFRGVGHDACARGDWAEVRRQLIAAGRKARALKDDERELKEFYTLGPDTLWFTFAMVMCGGLSRKIGFWKATGTTRTRRPGFVRSGPLGATPA